MHALNRLPLGSRCLIRHRHGTHHLDYGQGGLGQVAVNEFSDGHQQTVFLGRRQGNGQSGSAGTAGAADAVDIVLRRVGQFVVDHTGQFDDVDTARGDVGGHQQLHLALFEAVERSQAFHLCLVAVDDAGGHAALLQLPAEFVCGDLGAGEHQCLADLPRLQAAQQRVQLGHFLHPMYYLLDQFCRGVAAGDFDFQRVLQKAVRQADDAVIESGRKQQGLPLGRQQVEDALQVWQEAHVQHAIGFVQYQELHLRKLRHAVRGMVE